MNILRLAHWPVPVSIPVAIHAGAAGRPVSAFGSEDGIEGWGKRFYPRQRNAFTLIELLVVVTIMAIIVGFAAVSWQNMNSAGRFNKALREISGILEQGRAYAVAQDTYVWVALYQNTPANNGPLETFVATFASNDGTDPFNWAGSVTMPSPGIVGSTTLSQITRMYYYKGVCLLTGTGTSLPKAPTNPNFPASSPVFQCTGQSDSGPVTLPSPSSLYCVIQFTPTGAARNGPNPIDSIWLGMQPSFSKTTLDPHNITSMKVNGFTGLTTIYRQ